MGIQFSDTAKPFKLTVSANCAAPFVAFLLTLFGCKLHPGKPALVFIVGLQHSDLVQKKAAAAAATAAQQQQQQQQLGG